MADTRHHHAYEVSCGTFNTASLVSEEVTEAGCCMLPERSSTWMMSAMDAGDTSHWNVMPADNGGVGIVGNGQQSPNGCRQSPR